MSSQTSKIILTIIITASILGGGFYYWENQENPPTTTEVDHHQTRSENPPTTTEVDHHQTRSENPPAPTEKHSTITILIPENYDSYKQNMTEFVQAGGQNPIETTKFIKKELTIPYTDDLIKASAQAAAEEIEPSGGPTKASVAYFKIENSTAYVLLNIDLDGWAGVYVSKAIIHPLIEKTLMQFPEITKVVFDYAPQDK